MTTAAVAGHGAEEPGGPSGAAARCDVPTAVLRTALERYLDLHTHPELSGAEHRTADRFARWLADDGYTVTRGLGAPADGSGPGTGVLGVLRRGDGPTVLLRAELDALPVTERTGLRWASTVPGVMHACAHDLHLAALAGAAGQLARAAADGRWQGTLLVLGQPAEETLNGARALLEEGLYDRFGVPDVVLAQHSAPLPAGTVAHPAGPRPGPVLAGGTSLDVCIRGRGGHGGTPHLTVDPVLTAAAAVLRLQQVVSRETAPAEQAVLTVGALHAGERANVVPDTAELRVGLRGFGAGTLDRLEAAVERIVRAECAAADCPEPPAFTVTSRSPVLRPDPRTARTVRDAHARRFGERRVLPWQPGTAAEDFAWFGPEGAELHGAGLVRTAYWMVGVIGARQWRAAAEAGSGGVLPANHSAEFAPDPRTALPTAIAAMTSAALHSLDVPEGEAFR